MAPGYGIGAEEAVSFLPGGASDGEPVFDNLGGLTVFYEPFDVLPIVQQIEVQPGFFGGFVQADGSMIETAYTTEVFVNRADQAIGVYCRTAY